jgi:thioredoxin-related protein
MTDRIAAISVRKLLFCLWCGWLAGCARAPELEWLTDLPKAQAKAKAEDKAVLVDFTGSDWCAACFRFQQGVAQTPEFAAYAKTNLVLVEVDFPQGKPQSVELKKANAALIEEFKIADPNGNVSFPTFVLLNSEGKELGRWQGYEPDSGPKKFIERVEAFWKK